MRVCVARTNVESRATDEVLLIQIHLCHHHEAQDLALAQQCCKGQRRVTTSHHTNQTNHTNHMIVSRLGERMVHE